MANNESPASYNIADKSPPRSVTLEPEGNRPSSPSSLADRPALPIISPEMTSPSNRANSSSPSSQKLPLGLTAPPSVPSGPLPPPPTAGKAPPPALPENGEQEIQPPLPVTGGTVPLAGAGGSQDQSPSLALAASTAGATLSTGPMDSRSTSKHPSPVTGAPLTETGDSKSKGQTPSSAPTPKASAIFPTGPRDSHSTTQPSSATTGARVPPTTTGGSKPEDQPPSPAPASAASAALPTGSGDSHSAAQPPSAATGAGHGERLIGTEGSKPTAQPPSSVAAVTFDAALDSGPSGAQPQGPQPPGSTGRTIILCFDGTGNKFGKNSNVIRFFHALKKTETKKQIVYYQAGIGTYLKSTFKTRLVSYVVSKIDEAIALHMADHVKDGYRFLMQSYQKGDKVCLFGFSRGAYTARALSGMVYKIGLLPMHNMEQVDFAFTVYNNTSSEGSKLGSKFKRVFATPIKIDFLGVWDTVSSVGIIPRSLPYSSQNDGVRVFRHALALDERRARFRPNIWGEPLPVREQLDDDPEIKMRDKNEERDDWIYEPPAVPNVSEVWFAGCHADVGGGSHEDTVDVSLSNITLRWMIKECFMTKTGILFDEELLKDCDLDIAMLSTSPEKVAAYKKIDVRTPAPPTGVLMKTPIKSRLDVIARTYDQLYLEKFWWALELFPMIATQQREDGSWWRFRLRNLGKGRYLPFGPNHQVKVHKSVEDRVKNNQYKPAASNWDDVMKRGLVSWVD